MMTITSSLSTITFTVLFTLGIILLIRNSRDKKTRLFSYFLFTGALWALGDFMSFLALHPAKKILWEQLGNSGAILLPTILLHFTLHYSTIKLRWWHYTIYIPSIFFIPVLIVSFQSLLVYNSENTGHFLPGQAYYLFSLSIVFLSLLSIIILIKNLKAQNTHDKKKKRILLISSIVIPILLGGITEILLPSLGVPSIQLGSRSLLISGMIYAVLIVKYGLLRPPHEKIEHKLTIILMFVIILMSCISFFTEGNSVRSLELQNTHQALNTNLYRSKMIIDTTIEQDHDTTEIIATEITPHVLEFMNNESNEQQKKMIFSILERHEKTNNNILKISLLNKDGLIVLSTDTSSLDVKKTEVLELLEKKNHTIKDIHQSKGFGIPCIDYALAIRNNRSEFVAGLIVDYDVNRVYEILTNRESLGTTGELYLINKDGLLISPSRFNEKYMYSAILNRSSFKGCLGPQSNTSIYGDYRGNYVLGKQALIKGTDWCLLAEKDISEIYMRTEQMQIVLFSIYLIFTIICIILAKRVTARLTNPLNELTESVMAVSKGEDMAPISIESNDEIKILAEAFETMRSKIQTRRLEQRSLREKLEEQVKVRTQELEEKNRELQQFNNMIIGRELKMIELKKENKKLRENKK